VDTVQDIVHLPLVMLLIVFIVSAFSHILELSDGTQLLHSPVNTQYSLFEHSQRILTCKTKETFRLRLIRTARLVCQLGCGNDRCLQALREVRFFLSLSDS
jgi:hypothetical protein